MEKIYKERGYIVRDLAEKISRSDREAFNRLFDLLWEPMHLFVQSIIMDENTAKDVLQEVWLDYWERRKEIKNTNIKAYLYQASRNKIYKHFRNIQFKLNSDQMEMLGGLVVASDVELQHNTDNLYFLVQESLKGLPERCREIFTLSRLEGLDNDTIAKQLGISKRSVENQLSISLKKVKRDLYVSPLFLSAIFFLI